MAKKLFVSGLTVKETEADLNLLFSQASTVESTEIMVDGVTGAMQDYGFVVMSSDQEANKAITMFDGYLFHGRSITVYPARPRIVRNPPPKPEDNLAFLKE